MPQMFPLNWFVLFIFFLMSLIVMMAKMYFLMNPSLPGLSLKKQSMKSFSWKW